MRYHFFLHYGWFFQNLGKEAVWTNMHTSVDECIQKCNTQIGKQKCLISFLLSSIGLTTWNQKHTNWSAQFTSFAGMTELKGVVSDSFSHLQFYNGQNLVNSPSFSITMGLICFLTWYNFVNMSRLVLNQQMTLNPRMWFDMILQIHVSKLFLNHKVSWLPLHKLNKWHRTTKMHLDMILSYLVIRENELWTCLARPNV